MNRLIVLDTNVAGLLVNPRPSPAAKSCRQWFETLIASGDLMVLPEIADYELRREFLLTRSITSIFKLQELVAKAEYVRINSEAMRLAASFWAEIRRQGKPTADPHALDGDVILAAQAVLLDDPGGGIVIATTNVRHLSRFAVAQLWTEIKPET